MTMIQEILEYIENNPSSFLKDISAGLGVDKTDIRDDLSNLIREGYINKKSVIIKNESVGSTSKVKFSISAKGLQLLNSMPSRSETSKTKKKYDPERKKIFISHSFHDRKIADRIINHLILPLFAIEKKNIFYTSNRATGIEISKNWRNKIKSHIHECDIYICLITSNFQKSELCQNELGAAWVLNKSIFPLILAPVTYSDFSILISDLQALDLSRAENIESFVTSLSRILKTHYNIYLQPGANLENQIKKFGKSLRQYLRKNQGIFNSGQSKQSLENGYLNKSPEKQAIIEKSKVEWPDDYVMQEHYVKNQLEAMRQLNNLPNQYKNRNLVETIINKARQEWPEDYEMQLHTAKEQIEAYKRTN